jgi:hypothetical protein
VLLGINQGLTWSTTVIMKIDLAGPRQRGLAMGASPITVLIQSRRTDAIRIHQRNLAWAKAILVAKMWKQRTGDTQRYKAFRWWPNRPTVRETTSRETVLLAPRSAPLWPRVTAAKFHPFRKQDA